MIWPVGDDLNKRDVPVVGMMLIAVNFFVFCYEQRLWNDLETKWVQLYMAGAPEEARMELYKNSDYEKFLDKFAASRKNVEAGHVMCLVTATFLHADFWHLFGNMMCLWALVGTLESALGSGRFLFFYLLWGVIASASHVLMNWSPHDPGTIGASGAIAGMIGAYLVTFGALTKIKMMFWLVKPFFFSVPAGLVIILWVLSQMSGIDAETTHGNTGVAWFAHAGGFVIGAVTMLAFSRDVKERLYRDKDGQLHLRTEEELAKVIELENKKIREEMALNGQAVDEPPPPPKHECPYCQVEITDAHKIHDKLWRCPGCNNMILK